MWFWIIIISPTTLLKPILKGIHGLICFLSLGSIRTSFTNLNFAARSSTLWPASLASSTIINSKSLKEDFETLTTEKEALQKTAEKLANKSVAPLKAQDELDVAKPTEKEEKFIKVIKEFENQ